MAQELDLSNLTDQQKSDIMYAYWSQPRWGNSYDSSSGVVTPGYGPTLYDMTDAERAAWWDDMNPQQQQIALGYAAANDNFAAAYDVSGIEPLYDDPNGDPRQSPGYNLIENGRLDETPDGGGTAGSGIGNSYSGSFNPIPITLDESGYQLSPQAQADVDTIRNMANSIYGRDAGRFDVDPYSIPATQGYTYDPATADIYTTDLQNVFDPTRSQLDYAGDMLDYAVDLNGTDLQQAAALQYLAATGQAPSAADLALNRDANAMFAQQMAMAARARGSSSSGLATMNAQNNAALGYAQLVNAADIARAQEMAAARQAYAQTGLGIRQGDLQGAQQANNLANTLYQVNNSELGGMQENTRGMNQGSQYNTGVRNEAGQFGAQQMQAASAGNMQGAMELQTGNMNRAADVSYRDDTTGMNYADKLITVGENDRGAGITYQQNLQEAMSGAANSANNFALGIGGQNVSLTGQREAAEAQRDAAIIGAVGTAAAGAAGMMAGPGSDERMKTVRGKGSPADFSGVKPAHWKYSEDYDDAPGTEWLEDGEEMESGMAQDFPDDVVEKGPDGMMRVNPMKAMLRYADAIGDVQRRLKKAGI